MPKASSPPKEFIVNRPFWRIDTLPHDPTDEELAQNWTLSIEDLEEVMRCRGDSNRQRFAVQLCCLRNTGRFLNSYQSIPLKIINHLSRQIELPPILFLPEPDRPATESTHRSRLQIFLGLSDFTPLVEERLSAWLKERAVEGVPAGEMFKRAEVLLLSWKVLLPPAPTLEKMIAVSIAQTQTGVFAQIARLLPEGYGKELDGLLETGGNQPRSLLFYLKEYPPQAKPTSILNYLEKYRLVRSLIADKINLEKINPALTRHLTFLCKRYDAWALRRFADEKRWAMLASFLIETEKTLLDHLVEMNDQYLIEMTRHARSAYEEKFRDFRRKAKAGMETVLLAVENLLAENASESNDSENNINKNTSFFSESKFDKSALRKAVEVCRTWTRLVERGLLDELSARYPSLRRYFLEFLNLPFEAERGGEPLLEAIELLREEIGERIRTLPDDAPVNFVPAAWRKSLRDENGRIDQKLWVIALSLAMREALRAGTLYLPTSRRHVSFWNLVYSEAQWRDEREQSYVELVLPSEPDEMFANLKEEFQSAVRAFIKSLEKNDFAAIRKGKLKLKHQDAIIESENTKQLRRVLEASLPRIRIEDLLLEVDVRCDFTNELRPLQGAIGGGHLRGLRLRQTKLAALIAHGTNLGISAMGNSTEEITADMLQNVSRLYLNETNLKAANAALVNFHHQLAMSSVWGEGTTSSSDGQRFGVQQSSLIASYYPRYFGYYEQAVTVYTHLSDQHSVFSTQVISCTPREALYVLDGLLENDTILRHREHYTDTHGFTEQLFGLCYLLGFQFAPRFKDLADQQLYKIDKHTHLGKLQPLFRQTIDWELIKEQYDQLVRVAASLKNRTAPAHVVLKRLRNSTPMDKVAKALTALGRVIKTIYILRYLSDENLRRRVQRQLNRGEYRHFLARYLFFANRGEFRSGDYEEIMNKASCLSLLSNAILVWNTLEMTKIINQLKASGEEIKKEDLAHISPLLFSHVIPNGTYRFRNDGDNALNTLE
jgi:TnpA family transposase